MSSTFNIFAEHRKDGGWALIGEPTFSKPWGLMRPPEWLELNGKADLVTVFTGRLTSYFGLDHTGLEPIASPRGVPNDLSPVLHSWAEVKIEDGVAWNPSWLMAQEILDYDWYTRKILHRGYVSADLAHHFDPEHPEAPFPYDVWPEGDYLVATGPRVLETWIHRGKRAPAEQFVCNWPHPGTVEVHWSENHYEALGRPDDFLNDLAAFGPPDAVRLVFWTEM